MKLFLESIGKYSPYKALWWNCSLILIACTKIFKGMVRGKIKIFIRFQWIPHFINNPLNIFSTSYVLFNMLFQKAFLSTFLDDFC